MMLSPEELLHQYRTIRTRLLVHMLNDLPGVETLRKRLDVLRSMMLAYGRMKK